VSRRYENPTQPEQVEAGDGHPLQELAILLGGVVAIGAALVAVIAFSATWIAPKIPFRFEQQLAEGVFREWKSLSEKGDLAREQALRALADRLAGAMDLPREMSVTVHYDQAHVLNAFASLGGHIVVYRGLIERMPNEDALAAVIAHEIAHVRHRHPAASLGRGVALALVLSAVGISTGSGVANRVIGAAPNLALLKFSRDQEAEADADAMRAIVKVYGHVGGLQDLFHVFREARPDAPSGVQFLLTHPVTAERLQNVASSAAREGWPTTGERRPLDGTLKPQGRAGQRASQPL
jgi:predicted Zn-dependent protease